MPMIDRYKKPGGFLQLLILIETCPPQKQEKFLAIIHDEAPAWEQALRKRILTIDRIVAWNEETLTEIVTRLQPLTLGIALQGLAVETQEKLVKLLSHSLKRQVEDRKAIHTSGPAEIAAANIKILTEVREMANHGILRFEKFDTEMIIEEKMEEKLMHGGTAASAPGAQAGTNELVFNVEQTSSTTPHGTAGAAQPGTPNPTDELEFLRRKVSNLNSEIVDLKRDNRTLFDRLQQIRKMAS